MTGVIVRSSANVAAGARTRGSAILHGVWLLVFCAMLPFVLREIPTAVLAAVLVFTGYKLVDVAAIRELARFGRIEVGIYAATLVTIVTVDLLTGVVLGIGLSLARLLIAISTLHADLTQQPGTNRWDLHLTGAATVMRLPRLASVLDSVPRDADFHVHLEGLGYIDHACIDLLMSWEKQNDSYGGRLSVDWPGLEARFHQPGVVSLDSKKKKGTEAA
jgi:MFS superfamily sulfate permease-like transporter